MEIVIYESISGCARKIRKQVFEEEQGLQNEFDEKDAKGSDACCYLPYIL